MDMQKSVDHAVTHSHLYSENLGQEGPTDSFTGFEKMTKVVHYLSLQNPLEALGSVCIGHTFICY